MTTPTATSTATPAEPEPIVVRTSVAALLRSPQAALAVATVAWCLLVAGILLVGGLILLPGWAPAFLLAAAAPVAGIAVAVERFARLWRARRAPVLIVDEDVYLPGTGIRFPLVRLGVVQVYRRGADRCVALLPDHETGRVPDDLAQLTPYIVRIPAGAEPHPYELAELLREREPSVGVDKLPAVT